MDPKKILKKKPWEISLDGHDWKSLPLVAIQCFDDAISEIQLRSIQSSLKKTDYTIEVSVGSELSSEILSEKMTNLSLFGEENFKLQMILRAERLNASSEKFIENFQESFVKPMVLIFTKDSAFLKRLKKAKTFPILTLTRPPFWENSNYFEYLVKEKGYKLERDASLECLKADYSTLELLGFAESVLDPGKVVRVSEVVKKVQDKEKGNFELVDLLSSNDEISFYKACLKNAEDKDYFKSQIHFLLSHFVKVRFPSYMDGKAKLSKYDQSVIKQNKMFGNSKADRYIERFQEIEHTLKIEPKKLTGLLRGFYLGSLHENQRR
ncbi:MAG: hypothetical protein ACPGJV_12530 [Bacteriovoracaceae bacterium]